MYTNKEDVIKYFTSFKELRNLTKELKFGNNPPLPSVFTEKLCKMLFELKDYEGVGEEARKFDAVDKNGNNIEIKATSSKSGRTTLNPYREFDYLYWLYFDFDNDRLEVKVFPFESFSDEIEQAKNKGNDPDEKIRISISLRSFDEHSVKKCFYEFTDDKIKKLNCE